MKIKKDNHSGMTFIIYPPETDTKRYSVKDIRSFLKRFKLNNALRVIGELSYYIVFEITETPYFIKDVPITESALSYLSMCLIEESNDYRSKSMTADDLVMSCDMYHRLIDPIENNGDRTGFLIRTSAIQFDEQREMRNVISRMLIIYSELWPISPYAKGIDIRDAIQKISGLSIKEILLLGMAFTSRSEHGFLRTYKVLDSENAVFRRTFAPVNQEKFLNWLSCDYTTFRKISRGNRISNPQYEKFSFNPLRKFPILRPDQNPAHDEEGVFIVPVPRLIFDRVTKGLYFELSDHFRGVGGSNKFRVAFGYVFQAYIGNLLRHSLPVVKILEEFPYGKPVNYTPDWIIVQDDTCVLIEAKQSSIYLDSRLFGDHEQLSKDLDQTVSKALRQMWRFHEDLRSGRHDELKALSEIKKIERLVITYDRTFFENSVLQDIVIANLKRDGIILSDEFHYQMISVEEFEYILDSHGGDLYGYLAEKRTNPKFNKMDFREYHYYKNPKLQYRNAYLDNKWSSFFRTISRKKAKGVAANR